MFNYLKQYFHLLWRKYGKLKILIGIPLILSAVYIEWLSYFILPFHWPNLNCGLVNDVHRILFVADPQILGENTESTIARVDCDWFLKSTFDHALKYVKPDIVIFLGDLMDEGSRASPQQYQRYYKRFRNIFQLDYFNQTIFLPGDNDIGGENEDVTEYKVRRFGKFFPSDSDVISHKNIKFFKVNSMLRTFPEVDVKNDSSIRILLSHIPLLGVHSTFGEQAILQLKPLLIFSAHDHKSVHLVTGKGTPSREIVEELEVNQSAWRFNLLNTDRVNEIVVPTSSYRMGTPNIGFGVALLSMSGDVLCYFTLWSPCRLIHLIFYVVLITLTLFAYLMYAIVIVVKNKRRIREVLMYNKLSV